MEGTPLLDVMRGLILEPEAQADFAADPSGYMQRFGYDDVPEDDLREAVGLVADTLPPDVAHAVNTAAAAEPGGDDFDEGAVGLLSRISTVEVTESVVPDLDDLPADDAAYDDGSFGGDHDATTFGDVTRDFDDDDVHDGDDDDGDDASDAGADPHDAHDPGDDHDLGDAGGHDVSFGDSGFDDADLGDAPGPDSFGDDAGTGPLDGALGDDADAAPLDGALGDDADAGPLDDNGGAEAFGEGSEAVGPDDADDGGGFPDGGYDTGDIADDAGQALDPGGDLGESGIDDAGPDDALDDVFGLDDPTGAANVDVDDGLGAGDHHLGYDAPDASDGPDFDGGPGGGDIGDVDTPDGGGLDGDVGQF